MRPITNLILILSLTTSMYSCQAQDNCEFKLISVENILDYSFTQYNFEDEIEKRHGSYRIETDENQVIILRDTLVEEESPNMMLFEYVRYIRETNHYLIYVTLLTESQYWLINKSNGEILKLKEVAKISNNGNYILTYDRSITDSDKNISLFKFSTSNYLQSCDFNFKNEIIEDAGWIDDTSSLIILKHLDDNKTLRTIRVEK